MAAALRRTVVLGRGDQPRRACRPIVAHPAFRRGRAAHRLPRRAPRASSSAPPARPPRRWPRRVAGPAARGRAAAARGPAPRRPIPGRRSAPGGSADAARCAATTGDEVDVRDGAQRPSGRRGRRGARGRRSSEIGAGHVRLARGRPPRDLPLRARRRHHPPLLARRASTPGGGDGGRARRRTATSRAAWRRPCPGKVIAVKVAPGPGGDEGRRAAGGRGHEDGERHPRAARRHASRPWRAKVGRHGRARASVLVELE